MKKTILEQYSAPEWKKVAPTAADTLKSKGCDIQKDSNQTNWCKVGSCEECPEPPKPNTTNNDENNDNNQDGSVIKIEVPDIHPPDLSKLKGLITNAWGRITSWFGKKVDDTGEWMKEKFTKSDIERAQEDCFKVPFKDEESAKKSLESGDILDYYQLKDVSGNTIFLGKAWDCENKGGIPPCFKNLSGGKYNSSSESYTEEYFEEFEDAGVYEYFCNGTVSFKPYYESDETGGYVESDRPKVWYKWDPKTGVINKS